MDTGLQDLLARRAYQAHQDCPGLLVHKVTGVRKENEASRVWGYQEIQETWGHQALLASPLRVPRAPVDLLGPATQLTASFPLFEDITEDQRPAPRPRKNRLHGFTTELQSFSVEFLVLVWLKNEVSSEELVRSGPVRSGPVR
ncbi:hypothetical protein D4764_11G0008880 [Takifugu flavidus]|uniref:Uncharacterized protein n=1 Tax=Takifugu flavidus TaxID=433684 RepID=A0A5C6PK93_9TELE|nr:hypothetical protein D4764_11G0008880 [Takifugu flavidus]